jgi:Zn finger protein HypA/HybF involved in hydrogenase expression
MHIVVSVEQEWTEVLPMTENEQVEEMAKIIGKPCYTIMNEAGIEGKECTLPYECHECSARRLYAKDYRKVERGEWIYDAENECFICPKCKSSALNNYRGLSVNSDFCPNCGADMRGERNEGLGSL